MTFRVLVDACVLIDYQLCDLILRLSEADLYQLMWSEDILDEVERNLVTKRHLTPEKARRRVDHMRGAFPFAEVNGYAALIPSMSNDPKDRHVLAAAVRGHADLILTANVKDFPAAATGPFGIAVVRPSEFLLDQLDLDPAVTLRCLREQREEYKQPAYTRTEFYQYLSRTSPEFAALAEQMEQDQEGRHATSANVPIEDPVPLQIVTEEEAMQAFLLAGSADLSTPLGVAYNWLAALVTLGESPDTDRPWSPRWLLDKLSLNPPLWGDYRAVAAQFNGWSMTQGVHPSTDAPEEIVHIKMIPDTGHPMMAFGQVALEDFLAITLVRMDGLGWFVWGVSQNFFSSAAAVHGIE